MLFRRIFRRAASVISRGARRSQRDLKVKLGVFSDLFDLAEFKILDVGARGGALDWVTFLAPFGAYYACEPDASARLQLKRTIEAAHPWKNVVVVPEALAPGRGTVHLYLTRHEGMSSLLKPNMEVARTFGLESEFSVEQEVEVPAVTLKEAASTYGFEDLCLIKVDTQGSELSILESGVALVAGSVQGIFIEVEFREFYERQPLFSEIELFLRQFDFELISLEGVTRRRVTRPRLSYSRRELVWAHALFMKRAPDPNVVDAESVFRQTVQQIGIAMAREQFDLAAERLVNPQFQSELLRRGLVAGLPQLEACIRRLYSGRFYRAFCASRPDVVKDRERYFFR